MIRAKAWYIFWIEFDSAYTKEYSGTALISQTPHYHSYQ